MTEQTNLQKRKNFNIQFEVLKKASSEGALDKDWLLSWVKENEFKNIHKGRTRKNPICVEIVKREMNIDPWKNPSLMYYISLLERDGHYPKEVSWSRTRKDPKYRQTVLEAVILEKYKK